MSKCIILYNYAYIYVALSEIMFILQKEFCELVN